MTWIRKRKGDEDKKNKHTDNPPAKNAEVDSKTLEMQRRVDVLKEQIANQEADQLQDAMKALATHVLQFQEAMERGTNTGCAAEQQKRASQMQAKIDVLQAQIASERLMREQLNESVRAMTAQIAQLQKATKPTSREIQKATKQDIDTREMPTNAEILEAKKELAFRKGYFHVAFAGHSKTGKSSLAGAMCGMRYVKGSESNDGPPAISLFELYPPEAKVLCYELDDDPSEVGSSRPQRWDYFKDWYLFVFDAIILLWDNRLTDSHAAILMASQTLNIPCFLVRSKCDAILQGLRKEVEEKLEAAGISRSHDEFDKHFNSRFEWAVCNFRHETQTFFDKFSKKQDLRQHKLYLVSVSGLLDCPSLESLDSQMFLRDFNRLLARQREAN